MRKTGRPKVHQKQKRMSISFSDDAWNLIQLVKPGKVSELVSISVVCAGAQFPHFFIKVKKSDH